MSKKGTLVAIKAILESLLRFQQLLANSKEFLTKKGVEEMVVDLKVMKKNKKKLIGLSLAAALVAGSGTTVMATYNLFPWGAAIEKPAHGWTLDPAGEQLQIGDRPFATTVSPDGNTMIVSNNGIGIQSLVVVDMKNGEIIQKVEYKRPESLYIGVTYSPNGKYVYASAGNNNKIRIYEVNNRKLIEQDPILLPEGDDNQALYPAGMDISKDGKYLYVANNKDDSMSVIDLQKKDFVKKIPVGHNPYTVVLAEDGKEAYVSNWGENTVSIIDTKTQKLTGSIKVGTHPNSMKLNPSGQYLYVTNPDSDSVSIVDTKKNVVERTIDLSPYKGAEEGSSPDGLAFSQDGKQLYVTNAGNNDVVVIDVKSNEIKGMIPTAWYPTSVEVSKNGKQLFITSAKGFGAGPNPGGPKPGKKTPPDQYVGSMPIGSLAIVDVPNEKQLKKYTDRVVALNGFDERDKVRIEEDNDQKVIPRRVGESSPIKHVIYVVKENRTYDQVFGSLEKGNGDPSLNLFDDKSAPNHRQLARDFVTIDNFYADADVSADGWNWITAGMANTYVEQNFLQGYGGRGRTYDYEGGNFATAPSKDPKNAYLWDNLEQAGVDYRNYGFFKSGSKVADTEPELAKNTDMSYPGYNLKIKDQDRVDEWMKEFKVFEDKGDMPTFQFLRLPSDHTSGTRPGRPTPEAMVADNDLALGRVIEAVSNSEFWKDTAIFVTEDDAQNGPDHVDSHRTVALVISPYTKTGIVDSTFYTTTSMLRTMELIVGAPPMTQFDAAATPMVNSFVNEPNLTPYKAIVPEQPLDELNGQKAPLAAVSLEMNLETEDKAPEQLLNKAIWKSIKGKDSEMPQPKTMFRSNESEEELEEDA